MNKIVVSFAKNPWFTEYCQYLNPGYVPTPQNTCQGVMIKNYDSFPLAIINFFPSHKGFFSLMTIMWTSKQHLSYIGICTNFIDDHWILQKRLFKMLEHIDSGVNMTSLSINVL